MVSERNDGGIVIEGLFLIVVVLFGSIARGRDEVVAVIVLVFELELGQLSRQMLLFAASRVGDVLSVMVVVVMMMMVLRFVLRARCCRR